MKKLITLSLFALVLSGCGRVQDEATSSVYKNSTYGFQFEYPKDMVFVTPTYPELEDKIVQIQTEREIFPNTNFGDAAFSVAAVYAKDLAECLKFPQVESAGKFDKKITVNGVDFHMMTSTGAAAGNLYESKIYRALVGGQLCMELNETVHTTNIGNYEPGTVTEVDKEPIWERLKSITKTFKLTQ